MYHSAMIDWWCFTSKQQYFSYVWALNMKWMIRWPWNDDDMKHRMGHKDNRGHKVYTATGIRERWVSTSNLASCSGAETPPIEYYSSVFNVQGTWHFPNTVHHYGLRSGFPYYGQTTPACRMPNSTTWGTQPSCCVDRAPWPTARVVSAF